MPALYPAQQIALGDWPTYDGYRLHGALDQVEFHTREMKALLLQVCAGTLQLFQ